MSVLEKTESSGSDFLTVVSDWCPIGLLEKRKCTYNMQYDVQNCSGSDTSPSASTAAVDDEAPVQGPLPAEPDDAPWKRTSGIRKLYVHGYATPKLFNLARFCKSYLKRALRKSFTVAEYA